MSTAPRTIIVAGATGNTGRGVVSTLSALLSSSSSTPSSPSTPDSTWRILALTRTLTSPSALSLAALANVEVVEKDWTTITAAWLTSVNARRAFIAPHIGVGQFHDEALFHSALCRAGVSYVVRISTSAGNVRPGSGVSHGLNHWAAEELLAALPLHWTSLRPNLFTGMIAAGPVQWLKDYKAGTEEPLKVVLDETAGVAAVDPFEVGAVAAMLLALSEEQVQQHSGKKYTVNGPRDVRGDELVKLVEKYAHSTVRNVVFRDTSWVDYFAADAPPSLKESLLAAPRILWDGSCSIAQNPTSPEVLKLRAPANDALGQIDHALAEVKEDM